ncbi:hypothetical protein A7P54_03880 [Acinetobacter sp. Ac_3412]|uniref:hypothetical protein n=1 Tax=Acinetobacter sp. Ac_3412 TaxID=1848935 RepID=UPI0014900CAB|nr:hypothetical protein [Acinetobacter sp. Ac_3412]NNP75559.1 hypothetical protein [Acinetobacter sp. Ac_3412]
MALEVNIQINKDVSLWREYKDTKGNVLAEFKVRGIGYKPYQVALERANHQITSKGFDVKSVAQGDKLYHELVLEAAACHLIEDWKGVVFLETNAEGESIRSEPSYDPDNALKLLGMGDVGLSIWLFVKNEAEQIQTEADAYKVEIVGKSQPSTSSPADMQGSRSMKKRKGKP